MNCITGESVWGDATVDADITTTESPPLTTTTTGALLVNFGSSPTRNSTGISAETLANSWETVFDEASGYYYRTNLSTGESEWIVEDVFSQQEQEEEEEEEEQQQQQNTTAAVVLPAWEVESDPWESVFDPDSGHWYWVHKESGESVWAEDTHGIGLEL